MPISRNFKIAKYLRALRLKSDGSASEQTVQTVNSSGVGDGTPASGATLQEFVGNAGKLVITNPSDQDYYIGQPSDASQVNGIIFFNGTGYTDHYAGGSVVMHVDNAGIDITGAITTTGNITSGGAITGAGTVTGATIESVTGNFRTTGNFMEFNNDRDNNSSGSYGHLFYTNQSAPGGTTTPLGGFYSNDFYVQDNISAGRVYRQDATQWYNTDGATSITAYAGDGTYNYYTQLIARHSTDPDYGALLINTDYVRSQIGGTTQSDWMSHVLDNGGRSWHWQSVYAGRNRRGDSGTTANYRVGDHSVYAYSATGGTHGQGTYKGFTYIAGRETLNGDDVFAVFSGNDNAGAGGQYTIEFDASGNGRFDGGADISAADYAEYFEWADGNPDNEDRRGYPVVLTDDGKIRVATSSDADADFLGIISVEPGVVGDSAWAAWTGKWKRDKFNQHVYEDYDLVCWGQYDEEMNAWEHQHDPDQAAADGVEIPEDAITVTKQRKVLSSDFDPNAEYIPRKDRQEWEAVGMLGKLPLLAGQPTKSTWRKLFDLNDEVEMWLVR